MKFALKLAAGCAILIAAPASAQILGGGGGIGGSLGGAGGQLGGTLNGTLGNVNQTTRGTANGDADADVDRRSGRARARARGNGAVDSVTGTRIGQLNSSANASGNADIGAQAVGTDAVRGTVGHARDTARGTVDSARNTARGTAGSASAGANGSAGAGGSFQGGSANLAAAGSAAASSGAAIPVSPGMIVRDTSGRVIGRVQSLRARANGMVDNVIVRVGDRLASLPDENFSAQGSVLVSAMSQAAVSRAANGQSQARQGSDASRRGGGRRDPQQIDKR